MHRWLSLIDRVSVWMATGAAIVLAGLALFTFADVVLRYAFNRPIVGSIDVIQLALFGLVFLGLPYAGRSRAHIIVDLVPDYPSERLTMLRDATVNLLSALIFAILAWQAWLRAAQSASLGGASNMLVIPFWPFFYLMAASAAVCTVSLVLESFLLVSGRRVAAVKAGVEEGLDSHD